MNENLVDKIWTDRPSQPTNSIYHQPLQYAGMCDGEREREREREREIMVTMAIFYVNLGKQKFPMLEKN